MSILKEADVKELDVLMDQYSHEYGESALGKLIDAYCLRRFGQILTPPLLDAEQADHAEAQEPERGTHLPWQDSLAITLAENAKLRALLAQSPMPQAETADGGELDASVAWLLRLGETVMEESHSGYVRELYARAKSILASRPAAERERSVNVMHEMCANINNEMQRAETAEARVKELEEALTEARHCIVHQRDELAGDQTVSGHQWLMTHTVQSIIDMLDRAALKSEAQ